MMDLSKHIEFLLLTNDCVIIPQFGAFVAQKMCSRYSQDEDLFLPPYRTVHFNPNIQYDDGLLLSSLSEHYHITQKESEKWCNEFIDSIRVSLSETDTADFGTIGVFEKDENGKIAFMPCAAGVTTPMFYALDTFRMKRLPVSSRARQTGTKTSNALIQTDKSHIIIRINKAAAKYIAAVAASVVLFCMYSTPLDNTRYLTDNYSQSELFIPSHLIYHPKSIAAVDAVNEYEKVEEQTLIPASQEEPTTRPKKIATVDSEGKYAIVLASSISKVNARNYVSSLASRDINAQVMSKGNMTRVVITGFQEQEEAQNRIKELKAMGDEFSQVWLLNLKHNNE